jgi:enoyl-CoA hydratase
MRVYDSFLAVRDLPIPVIAAINGPAVGAGVNLAMACGIRYLAPSAFFDISFIRLGIHPGGGATMFLVEALGAASALELILRGGRVDAECAVEVGLANTVVADPLAHALEFAAQLAGRDPVLVRDIVATVRTAASADMTAVVAAEATAQAKSFVRNPAILAPYNSRSYPE